MSSDCTLSLNRCDEDIDILSELLDTNSNGSESYEAIPEIIGSSEDIDELTSYLNSTNPDRLSYAKLGTTAATAQRHASSMSRSDPLLTQPMISGCHSQSPAIAKDTNQIPVVTSSGSEASPKSPSVVMVFPKPKSQVTTDDSYNPMPCMTRSAVNARENRIKKKTHLQQLEKDCQTLRKDNHSLKEKLEVQEESVESLAEQVAYLKSVIANQSTLSALLTNIRNVPGIKLKSSWSNLSKSDEKQSKPCSQKKPSENQENEKASLRRSKRKCVFEPENTNPKKCFTENRNNCNDGPVVSGSNSVSNVAPMPDPIKFDSASNRKEAGICLHVNGSQVSLELCAACGDMAASSTVLTDHSYVRPITDSSINICV